MLYSKYEMMLVAENSREVAILSKIRNSKLKNNSFGSVGVAFSAGLEPVQ